MAIVSWVEGLAEPVAGWDVGSKFIVAASQVLHERVPGEEDPRRAVAFRRRISSRTALIDAAAMMTAVSALKASDAGSRR